MRGLSLAALLAGAACSSLSENQDGVASLELRVPTNLYLEKDVPLDLMAVARNRDGDSVAATFVWRTPDPDSVVQLDSLTGRVVGRRYPDSARIQVALAGDSSFTSDFTKFRFSITGRADTLELLSGDSMTVALDTDTSSVIDVRLLRLPDTVVSGRPVGFRIVDPVQTTDTIVVLLRGRLVDSAFTSTTGQVNSVAVHAVPGRTPPDRAVIEVTAYRASGVPIPGSPRHIVVRFLHQ